MNYGLSNFINFIHFQLNIYVVISNRRRTPLKRLYYTARCKKRSITGYLCSTTFFGVYYHKQYS